MHFEFLNAIGLLGLIAVPVLILIYILKNKHTEQVIASTYLWTLGERFIKRRNPISRLAGIISLILQILVVVCISFAIAQPQVTIENAADDYVFVLDASGSMYYEQDGTTRFELGKKEIQSMIEKSANGSSYTVISVGESAGKVIEVSDKEKALSLLKETKPSATAAGFSDARGIAQECFAEKPAAKIYLITDKSYENLQNVELIQISSQEENYAVADLAQEIEKGKLVVSGVVCSYESDAELTLRLQIDDNLPTEQTVSVVKLEEKAFRFEVENNAFHSLKVSVTNQDALPLDNESMLYNVSATEQSGILLVSDDPFFMQTALESYYGKQVVESVETEKYSAAMSGYQLYIFEGFSPEVLPSDGAVWFINPQSSVTNSGFSVQGREELAVPSALTYSTSTATRIKELLKGTNKEDIFVKEYVKCSFYRNFHTLLSYNGSPAIFAGTNSYDNREVVFAFDFHKSDIILHFDYSVLVRNLLNYTFPAIVEKTSFYCGEMVPINVLANCKSIRIDTPSGDIAYLDVGSDLAEYSLTEVGTYKITQMLEDVPHTVYVYGNLPKSERVSTENGGEFVVEGEPSNERPAGIYDDLLVLFIILAVLFIADWVVYSYEQYQLR